MGTPEWASCSPGDASNDAGLTPPRFVVQFQPDNATDRMVTPPFQGLRLRLALLCACLLWAAGGPCAADITPAATVDPTRFAGQTLGGAIRDLSALGLRMIYSSDLVRPEMIVAVEPRPGPPRDLLEQILAPFGLEARDGPGGTVLIVQSSAASAAPGDAGRRLARRPSFREEIEVNPNSCRSISDRPESRTTLGPDEIGQSPRLGDDPNRIVARLPGFAAGDRSAEFAIRGGEPDETLFILDGLAIDDPFHLQGLLRFSSIIDSNALGSIEVLSGGFPVEYGGRMSGVVELASRRPTGVPRTSFSASSVNSSTISEGAFADGEARWLVSARAWRPDAMVDFVTMEKEGLDPAYYDILGKVETTVGDGTVISGHVLAARDGVDAETAPMDGHVTAHSENHYAWLNLRTPWTEHLVSTTVLSLGRGARRRQVGLADPGVQEAAVNDQRSFASETLGQDWIFEATDRVALKWGFGVKRIAATYDFISHATNIDPLFTGGLPATTDRSAALQPEGTEYGAYLSQTLHPVPSLTMELGVRADRQTLTKDSLISPRANIAFALGPGSALRLAWGRFTQPQGPQDLPIEDGVTRFFPGQRAEHLSVQFDHIWKRGARLGLAAYSKQMFGVRPRYENLFNSMVLFPEIEPDRILVAPSRSRATGFEATLAMDRGRRFGWWASYALARAEDDIDGRMVPRSRDQRHTFNAVVRRSFGSLWDVSLAGQYHSGWPTTSVTAQPVVNPDGSTSIQAWLGPRNAERLPPFHRLDLRLNRRFPVGRGTLSAFLEVTNLYGRDNVCCIDGLLYLPRSDGTVRVERSESFWLRQAPVFGVTWDLGP